MLGVAGLSFANLVRLEGPVPAGNAVRGGALEDRHPGGVLGDERERLDGRRARADDGDALASEIDRLVGPSARVVRLARETLDALDRRPARDGQAAGRHDQEARRSSGAPVGPHLPAVVLLVEGGAGDAGLERNVPAQVEAIGHVVQVAQDLRLSGVALAPVPLLLKLLGERVRVGHALDVAAGTGVAVPVPGAADVAGCLDPLRREPELSQAIEHVETGGACADDDRVGEGSPLVGALTAHAARILSPAGRTGLPTGAPGDGADSLAEHVCAAA